jgi:quercetin dioxygenase-like cupin family protein
MISGILGGACRKQLLHEGHPMNLNNFPADITDWSQIPASVDPGETGTATMRTRQLGEIQLRHVEYSPKYIADHWCHKGHIVFVVSGRLVIEHLGGAPYLLTQGASYHVPDGDVPPHRVRSEDGATIFIVD